MTLQLLISTLDDGISKIADMLLDPRQGITYLVSWQHSDESLNEIPGALLRNDVTVVHLQGRGLSRNRNNCIAHASGDICLICDDDCRYTHEGLNTIALTFATNRNLDIAAFKAHGLGTQYPDKTFDLATRQKNYHVSSIEIAFRRSSLQGRLQFNEQFGLGAPELHCGEEEVFIHDALAMGLSCKYFPAYVVSHDGPPTSVTRVHQPGTLKARGAYLYIAYRSTMIPRVLLISYRLHRDYKVPFFHAVRNMTAGILYIIKHSKRS